MPGNLSVLSLSWWKRWWSWETSSREGVSGLPEVVSVAWGFGGDFPPGILGINVVLLEHLQPNLIAFFGADMDEWHPSL